MADYLATENDFLLSQVANFAATKSMIYQEMKGLYGDSILADMNHIMKMYNAYERGADFTVDNNGDYVPAKLRYRTIKTLINKEARFLFSAPPDMTVISTEDKEDEKVTEIQDFVSAVLQENGMTSKLVKAAKDCFIGKRIAIVTNLNEEGISVSFIPSLEFVFETDPANVDKLTKFIQFYNVTVNDLKEQQRVYKKKFWLEGGFCWVEESMYNGLGVLVEELIPARKTALTWIPVEIVTNDGLSGDPFGESEIECLIDSESWYSKMSSKDLDSLRKGADQIIYAMDVSASSTKSLSRGAGAFWDLQSDQISAADGITGKVGVIENSMGYSPALETTLKRIKTDMYNQLDVPDTSTESLQGIITSGKSLKAIYWGLITRCNEKMLVWRPALLETMRTIIEGAKLIPEARKLYTTSNLEGVYKLEVENNYPLPEDETEEKQNDLSEVTAQTMSKRSYMMKWRGLSEQQADEEIDQLLLEKQLLEGDAFAGSTFTNTGGAEV